MSVNLARRLGAVSFSVLVLLLTAAMFAQSSAAPAVGMRVMTLPLQPTNEVWQDALKTYLEHGVVVLEGASEADVQRLLGVELAPQAAPTDASGTPTGSVFAAIALRNTPGGALNVFFSYKNPAVPASADGWRTDFEKWTDSQRRDSAKAAAAGDPESQSGWIPVYSQSVSSGLDANGNQAKATLQVSRLNSTSTTTDYYLVTVSNLTVPNFKGPCIVGCGWANFQRETSLAASVSGGAAAQLLDHGPTGTITTSTTGFTVGGMISATGPSVSASYSETWSQPSVTTTDRSDTQTALWSESFTTPTLFNIPGTSSGSFLSDQAAVFTVPINTPSVNITGHIATFWAFFNLSLPSITNHVFPINITVKPPQFLVSPLALTVPVNGTNNINVTATVGNSGQQLSWAASPSTGTGSWLVVPTGTFVGSQLLPVHANPSGVNGDVGYLSVNTVPPNGAPSVANGPFLVQVTVGNLAGTTTGLTATPSPVLVNTNTVLAASVGAVDGQPTGTVSFLDGNNRLGPPVPLANGHASVSTASLSGGYHSIKAVYSGDGSFASSSSTIQLSVTGIVTPITGSTADATTYRYFQPITYQALVVNPLRNYAQPTGVVALLSGNTTVASGQVIPQTPSACTKLTGSSTLDVCSSLTVMSDTSQFGAVGTATLNALYLGDAHYSSSKGASTTITINPALTSTSLALSSASSIAGNPVVMTAAVKLTSPHITTAVVNGAVQFLDGATAIGTVNIDPATGHADFTTQTLLPGAHTIHANYLGNSTISVSNDAASLNVRVNTATPSLELNPIAPQFGQSIEFQAQITPDLPSQTAIPTGNATFLDGCGATLNTLNTVPLVNGIASFSTSLLSGGAHCITATYLGDSTYQGKSKVLRFNISPASSVSVLSISQPSPLVYGNYVDLNANITNAAGTVLAGETGTVTFSYLNGSGQAVALGTMPLANGIASLRAQALPAGQYNFFVSYSGSADYLKSKSNPKTFSISIAQTRTVITAPATGTVVPLGQPITVSFTVEVVPPGGGIIMNDSVQIADSAFPNSSCVGKLTGTASPFTGFCTFTPRSAGLRQLVAYYQANDVNYNASQSNPPTDVTVGNNTTSTTLASSINPSAVGQNVTFTATVTGQGGTPTGSVTFKDGALLLGVTTLTGGAAGFSTSSLASGMHTLTATYSGTSTFPGSTSSPLSQSVSKAATATTLSSSANPSNLGQSVTFTASVTGQGGTPAGSVTFMDGALLLGTRALSGGVAGFSTSSLASGSHTITAVYGGSSTFAGSTSSPLSQTVAGLFAAQVKLVSGLNPSVVGQVVLFTATVSSVGGGLTPNGSITLSEGSIIYGSAQLIGGIGRASITISTAGLHPITATYGGDTSHNGAASSPVQQQVNPPPLGRTPPSVTVLREFSFEPNSSGFAQAKVAFDRQFVYVSSPDGAVYRSQTLSPSAPVQRIFDAAQITGLVTSHKALYVLTNPPFVARGEHAPHSILRSADHGALFVPSDSNLLDCRSGKCLYLVPNELLARDDSPLFTNAGGGENFLVARHPGDDWKPLAGSLVLKICTNSSLAVSGHTVVQSGECPLDGAFLRRAVLSPDKLSLAPGGDFEKVASPDLQNRNIIVLKHMPHSDIFVAGAEGSILRSLDDGRSFSFVFEQPVKSSPSYPYIENLLSPSTSPSTAIAAGFDKAVFKPYLSFSSDRGAHWTDFSAVLPDATHDAAVTDLAEDRQDV